jgi:hypothetical protein
MTGVFFEIGDSDMLLAFHMLSTDPNLLHAQRTCRTYIRSATCRHSACQKGNQRDTDNGEGIARRVERLHSVQRALESFSSSYRERHTKYNTSRA